MTHQVYVERARQRLIKRKVIRIVLSCTTTEHCVVAHNYILLAQPMLSDERNTEINSEYIRKILHVTGVVNGEYGSKSEEKDHDLTGSVLSLYNF